MANGQKTLTSVSDTSLWVAAVRANESRRADAVFRDKLASILAGERGRRIERSIPRRATIAWGVIARTSAIDRLIHDALNAGVDTIVNLGAGLDTRPYRMQLPPDLRWIELDFPHVMESKSIELRDYRPACRLERIATDLLDRNTRNGLLAQVGSNSEKILVITEGVISYFSNADVSALANDLWMIPSFHLWVQDFDNAGMRRLPFGWERRLKCAPLLFEPGDWFEFFKNCGWVALGVVTNAEEAERINRPYPWDLPYGLLMRALPRDVRQKILGLSGAVVLRRI
jgi:methyltransferase (TIGR00027 family)